MNAIELMNEEHKNILRMIKVVRKVCFNIMKGTEINYKDLEDIIEFIRNYADSHHHKKEEYVYIKIYGKKKLWMCLYSIN